MRRLRLIGLAFALLATGCKGAPEPPKKIEKSQTRPPPREAKPVVALPQGERVELGNVVRGSCRRTLCIGGPGELDSEPNADLAELCRRTPGIVMRCDAERCASVWAFDAWEQGLDALVGTLDRNADGKVDRKDPACAVSLAGWSTGAAVVADALPKALAERVDANHAKIHNLLAIAPFTPGREPQQLDIAATVDKAFIYRHSVAPETDCSRAFEGGPWRSAAPVCAEGTTCFDYDYTQDEGLLAYLSRRGSRSGAEIHHCNIVSVVARIGIDNLSRGQEAYREMIPPYADGTHGGRTRVPVYQPTPE